MNLRRTRGSGESLTPADVDRAMPLAGPGIPLTFVTESVETTNAAGAGNELARGLTSGQIAMIGLSGALGTGLFLGSGSMIAEAGPGTIVSYGLTGLLALVIVWCLAEMTVVHPVPGGFGAAARAYLGPLGGWLTRWNVAVVMCIAVGAEVVAVGNYLAYWWPTMSVGVGTMIASVLIILINMATVKAYGATEYWFSLIKVPMVIIFIALGVVLLVFGLPRQPAIGFGNLTAHGGFAPHGVSGILIAAVMAIFSFGGAENVSVAAAESEDPERDVPRAAKAMIIRLVLFYVLAIAIVLALQPWTVSASSSGGVLESPFVKVLAMAHIPAAAGIMNFVLVTAALSSGNGCLYASARMLYSLGRDGQAPRVLATTSDSGAPRAAVLVASSGMVIASLLAIFYPATAFHILFGVLVFGLLTTWTLIALTYIAFRRRRAALGLPGASSRLFGGPTTAAIAMVACLAAYIGLAFIPPLTIALKVGLPYIAVLLIGFWAVARRTPKFPPSILDVELARRHNEQGHAYRP